MTCPHVKCSLCIMRAYYVMGGLALWHDVKARKPLAEQQWLTLDNLKLCFLSWSDEGGLRSHLSDFGASWTPDRCTTWTGNCAFPLQMLKRSIILCDFLLSFLHIKAWKSCPITTTSQQSCLRDNQQRFIPPSNPPGRAVIHAIERKSVILEQSVFNLVGRK